MDCEWCHSVLHRFPLPTVDVVWTCRLQIPFRSGKSLDFRNFRPVIWYNLSVQVPHRSQTLSKLSRIGDVSGPTETEYGAFERTKMVDLRQEMSTVLTHPGAQPEGIHII